MATELDIDDVAAQSPLAQRQLDELRQQLAEAREQLEEKTRRLNEWASQVGTGSACKKCGRFYLHRDGCYPCQLAEAHEAIKAFAYSQRWCHDSWKNQDAIRPLFDIAKALAGREG